MNPSRSHMIAVVLCVGLTLISGCSPAAPEFARLTIQWADSETLTSPRTLTTDRETVGEALRDAQISVFAEDLVEPDLTTMITDGMTITIHPSIPVSITNFWGDTTDIRTRMKTVRALMADIGYIPAENEMVRPDMDTPITPELHIDLIRQSIDETEHETEIPFDTRYIRDDTKDFTYRFVQTPGVPGIRKKVVRATYENGTFTGRDVVLDETIKEPEDEVVVIGTQTPPNGTPLGTTKASFYGAAFHGRRTASGETFDKNAFTAAHRTLPFGSLVKVTNAANNQSVVVRITDRGPYAHGRGIDLSEAAFGQISGLGAGVVTVELETVAG